MKRLIIMIIQCLWGFMQSLLGLILFLFYIKSKHYLYRSSIITKWQRNDGLSLGLFIFIPANLNKEEEKYLIRHEYGHYIQSLLLGPLYLFIIGLPSIIWCKIYYPRKLKNHHINYYAFYPERWANTLSKRIIKNK